MIIKILITFVPGLVLLAFFIVYWRRRAEKRGQHTLRVEDIERGIESWGGGSQPCATCTGGDCCSEPLKTHKRQPEYYDDEELDRFCGRASNEYSDEEADEFREIFDTLLPEDRLGWLASIAQRGIALPVQLKSSITKATQPE